MAVNHVVVALEIAQAAVEMVVTQAVQQHVLVVKDVLDVLLNVWAVLMYALQRVVRVVLVNVVYNVTTHVVYLVLVFVLFNVLMVVKVCVLMGVK